MEQFIIAEDFPESEIEFEQRFSSGKACQQYLAKMKWPHALHPNLKTLYISGYTANVIAHRGVLDRDVSFIPKPFSKKDLAQKIREILDNDSGR
jgi:hypothetical protein